MAGTRASAVKGSTTLGAAALSRLSGAGQRRRLTPALERKLVLAAKRGDPGARGQLVETFLPLIASVARIYRGSRAVEHAELMQDGVVGLLRALERFDARRGTPFWAYASWWVRQAMQELVAELTGPVVLSDRALRQLARVKTARRSHLQAHKREPSTAELVATTGLTRDKVEALVAVDRTPRALGEPLGDDGETFDTFGELLADPTAQDAYDRVDRRLQADELRSQPSKLCDRERAVLGARYGLNGPEQTLRQIGGALHLSAERVRQIEEQALEKLRAAACGQAA
jgi:RNA polymerase primary sigma factor